MKLKLLSLVTTGLLLCVHSHAANLFWDPSSAAASPPNSGSGSGQGTASWNDTNRWTATVPSGVSTVKSTWNSATPDAANFARNPLSTTSASAGIVSIDTDTTAASITVGNGVAGTTVTLTSEGSAGLTVGTGSTSGLVNIQGFTNAAVNATRKVVSGLTFDRTGAGNGTDVTFTLSGTAGGTTGAGTLSLTNSSSDTGNLLVKLSGTNTNIANTGGVTASGASSGLTGFVSTTADAKLSTGFTANGLNNSIHLALLSATTGSTLTLGTGASVTGTGSFQVGSADLGYNGTVKLDAANAVNLGSSGKLILDAGTLLINTSGAIGGSTNITLSAAGSAANKVALSSAGGITDTVGTLTLTANSIIDFGTGSGNTLKFTGVSDVASWTGGLQIWNYTPGSDHLFFGTNDNGLGLGLNGTPLENTFLGLTQLTNRITFFTDDGKTLYRGLDSAAFLPGGAGEIVPVPEPTAALSAGLLLLAVGWRERRLFARVRGEMALPAAA